MIFLIGDARRNPGEDEAGFAQWLAINRIPFLIVLTKIDKLKRNMRRKSLNSWQQYLGTEKILLFSAVTGEGKDKLWQEIGLCLQRES